MLNYALRPIRDSLRKKNMDGGSISISRRMPLVKQSGDTVNTDSGLM